jgi:hypothetical protein
MAKQFSRSNNNAQVKLAMDSVQFDENITAQPDSVQITAWLSRLHLLYGIPFNYLVPDIRMLPDESIRFFQVDENWTTALIDGAYSLGTTAATSSVSQALQPQIQEYVNQNLSSVRAEILGVDFEQAAPANLSGFFLRSSVVSGWPGMEVTGYDDEQNPLTILRMERISPSLLLCLFNGVLAKVDIREPAETLHFCFDITNVPGYELELLTDSSYGKSVRYVNSEGDVQAGSYSGWNIGTGIDENRLVHIDELALGINTMCWAPGTPEEEKKYTSAEFGLSMVQNTDVVSFEINSQNEQV